MAVTRRQIDALAPYLEGNTPTHVNRDRETGEETREWNLICPLHNDHTRSASINIEKGVFYCNVCGGMRMTTLMGRKAEWIPAEGRGGNNGNNPNLNGSANGKPQRILTEGMIGGWHSALMSDASALRWLRERRGITQETIAKYEIGRVEQRLYSIPVRSLEDEIWNVRFYNPSPDAGKRKIWSEAGYGSPPRLYPIAVTAWDSPYYICLGGEWDSLITLQNDYVAITRTAGEDFWDAAWSSYFKDRIFYLGHDKDAKGVRANQVVGMQLEKVADVRVIEWPYDYAEKHGKDATDFFMDHAASEFQGLLDEAKPFSKRKRQRQTEDIPTVTVLDTFDSTRVGDPVKIITTIKGRKDPGYSIPKKVHLVCTRDLGQKCLTCPMNANEGDAVVNVEPDDPAVLAMIDAETARVREVIAEGFGVPGGKCSKLQQEVEEHQAVEVLFGRPALDFYDGSNEDARRGEYKNIKITSVGRHDTFANNTVAALGALQPNPRTQGNEFLAHSLETLETSVDRFTIGSKSIQMMKRFQPKNQTPLKKIGEIARALSAHVTKIQGRPEMHALMDLTFHSILSFSFAGEVVPRGWLDTLILGDTGTGKSTAARRLVHHYRAGEIVSCEAASFAGVVGGLQQMGGRDWAVTWGAIPINDRRIVFLDEVSGLTTEEIAQMSDIRSSGQAKLTKIQQEVTWSRTRLCWMGNPRGATMANFTYGVNALSPLIGNAEDVARFDLVMAVTIDDVPVTTINQRHDSGELRYTEEACHTLLMWAWTRQPEHVTWAKGAEDAVFKAAVDFANVYIEDPPLILPSSVRIKVARVAVAIAARLFSTDDETHERVIVTTEHVEAAVQFINILYGMDVFGYRERSRQILADKAEAVEKAVEIKQYLKGRPMLAKHLRSAGKFRRQDLEELMNISREEANGIINTLYEARMVRRHLGDIYVEPTLHTILRELKI